MSRSALPAVRRSSPSTPGAASRPHALQSAAAAALTLAAAVGAVALLTSTAREGWRSVQRPGPAAPSDGLLLVVCAVGAVLALWFAASVVLTALTALPGRAGLGCQVVAERLTPIVMRRSVSVLLGTSLTAVALPATVNAAPGDGAPLRQLVSASHSSTPEPASSGADRAHSPPDPRPELRRTAEDAGPSPSWTPVRPQPTPRAAREASLGVLHPADAAVRRDADEYVVVRRGDSLWDIAARHLGPGATAGQIAHEWPRWFAANRLAIGPDPDLLLPGQLLVPPPAHGDLRGLPPDPAPGSSPAHRPQSETDSSDARSHR